MNAARLAARVVMHPVHTAGSVAGRTIGVSLGAAKVGVRTTARVVGWAVQRAGGPTPQHPSTTYPSVTVPPAAPEPTDFAAPEASDDPLRATVTPPRKVQTRKAAARKVPASEVPLKSAPTPSLPAGVESLDGAVDDVATPTRPPAAKTAARRPPAKKAVTGKATARRAPSKQAAVLAPALGLSETEVAEGAEVAGDDVDHD